MSEIAKTPAPPYYAVIFSNHLKEFDEGYSKMAERMLELASEQPGFLGVESVRDGLGITVSYWKDLDSIKKWKTNVACDPDAWIVFLVGNSSRYIQSNLKKSIPDQSYDTW